MIEKYAQFLETARDQYDYFNSGRRKSDIVGEVQNKQLQQQQQAQLHQKPMWSGQGLPAGHQYIWEKPSKYKRLNPHIKSKIDTGLTQLLISTTDMEDNLESTNVTESEKESKKLPEIPHARSISKSH